jgi:hypothetical protein
MVALSALDEKDMDLDVMTHPLLNMIYYGLAEIIPSAWVLFILRKLPPKRTQVRRGAAPARGGGAARRAAGPAHVRAGEAALPGRQRSRPLAAGPACRRSLPVPSLPARI